MPSRARDPSELFWRQGLGGRLHLAKRLVQKMLRVRANVSDVVSGDMSLVGGARPHPQRRCHRAPRLITDWQLRSPTPIPMSGVESLLLDGLRGTR